MYKNPWAFSQNQQPDVVLFELFFFKLKDLMLFKLQR